MQTSPLFFLRGHSTAVNCVRFSERGDRLVSGDQAGEVKVWSLIDRECHATWSHSTQGIMSVHMSDNEGTKLITQSRDGLVQVIDTIKGAISNRVETNSYSFAQIVPVSLQPLSFLAPTNVASEVSLFDVRSGNKPQSHFIPLVKSAAQNGFGLVGSISPMGPLDLAPGVLPDLLQNTTSFAVGYESGEISIFDIRMGSKPLFSSPGPVFPDMQNVTTLLATSGRRLWLGGAAGCMAEVALKGDWELRHSGVWDVYPSTIDKEGKTAVDPADRLPDGAPEELQYKIGVAQIAVRPSDARVAVAACWDHRLRVYDVAKRSCLGILHAHADSVLCASFANEGGVFAAGSRDGKISVWSTSGLG